jgi:DNA-binding beta-propeller fold protein YncE
MKIRLGALAVSGMVICCGGSTDHPLDEGVMTGAGGASSADGGSSSNAGSSGNAGDGALGGSGGYGDITTGGAAGTAPATFSLTVTVNGEGRVTSTPAGIDCGSECEGTFAAGTHVQLATREQGGVLTAWSEACTGGSACSVTLDADARVTATFEPFAVGPNAHGVAVTPDGARALVTLGDSAGTLKLVSLSDGSIVDSIAVGSFPGAVAVTPDGSKAVVNNLHDVSIVTLSTKAVATVASPCAADTLYDIAVTPDGASAVTTMFNGSCVTNSVAMIALGGPSLGSTYPIPAQLTGGIAVATDGGSALVALGILGSTVSRVALSDGAITDITGTSSSFGIAVIPNGSEALVASGDGDTIKRVSLSSNSVTGSIDYASNQDPHNLAITPDGSLAVAVGSFDVGVLALATGTVAKRFSGGGRSVAITPDGKRALVTQGSTLRVFAL